MSQAFAGQTIETARRALTARLRAHAVDSAELEARLLAGAALGLDLTGDGGRRRRGPSAAVEAAHLEDMARRRLAGEPVARILGRKEFWGLPLQLSAATLVPRPDTETVVELALEMLRATGEPKRRWRIADIGTGSGAILLALLSEWPDATGVGTDLSAGALQTAHSNAVRTRTGGARGVRRLRSSPRRCRGRSTWWCQIRPMSAPPTSRVLPSRSVRTTRIVRWMAVRTDSTPTAR